jgi:prophage regulatory protein
VLAAFNRQRGIGKEGILFAGRSSSLPIGSVFRLSLWARSRIIRFGSTDLETVMTGGVDAGNQNLQQAPERKLVAQDGDDTPSNSSGSLRMAMKRTIRRPELRMIVPLADTTIYEMEQRGEFPRRFYVTSRCVVWDLAEVEAWIEERRQASNSERIKRAPGRPMCASAEHGPLEGSRIHGKLRRAAVPSKTKSRGAHSPMTRFRIPG